MIIKKRRIQFLEMAFSKSKYQDKITDRIQQIAQNWTLCTYCHLYNPKFRTYGHWKGELFDLLDYLNNLILSDKSKKYKWALEALVTQAEYDNPKNVLRACKNKFRLEQEINISHEKQIELCTLFAENISTIASCIASDTSALEYVDDWFPEVTISGLENSR